MQQQRQLRQLTKTFLFLLVKAKQREEPGRGCQHFHGVFPYGASR